MQIDLDQIVDAQILPWDLSIKIRGVSYITRPLLLADVALLQKVIRNADQSADDARRAVTNLFNDPKPDVGIWTMDQTVGAVKAILSYWQRSSEKNSRSISAAVEAEIVSSLKACSDSTPGSSTRL